MGANAQTTVPSFTVGQVLTADQQNQSARTGVPVFATTVERDAAFGGAGEKTLAEGQLAYLEDSDVVQYYDGASWLPVGTNPGFVVVKAETAFTTAASFFADNVFTSTYTNYAIMVNFTGTTSGVVSLQLRVGGVAAATNYNFQSFQIGGGTATPLRTTGATSFTVGIGSTGAFNQTINLNVFQPAIATATSFNNFLGQADTSYAFPNINIRNGNHSTATAYDGFEIAVASGTISGSYTVYGYGKTL